MSTNVYKRFDPRVMEREERIGISRGLPTMISVKMQYFLTHSEILYFLGIFIKKTSKNIGKYCIFILQRNLHEIVVTIL